MATAVFGGLTPWKGRSILVERTGFADGARSDDRAGRDLRSARFVQDARNRAAQRAPKPLNIVVTVRKTISTSSQGEKYLM